MQGPIGATEPVARAVADSPLVKCALFGGDPNWGRILQAAGQALPDAGTPRFDVAIEGVTVAQEANAVPLGDAERGRLEQVMRLPEVEMRLSLGDGEGSSEVFFCDLGHEYVRINAEYS